MNTPVPELKTVIAFLQGEGELDGVNFGDKHPTERGAFWWRKYLSAVIEAATLKANVELDDLRDALQFVERWANHHGTKPHMTAEQALGCIQHYPSILAITQSYTDGKVPETRNPWAELAAAEKRVAELGEGC